jgi:gliding motility-associated-like protein
VNAPGTYNLVVTNLTNDCTATAAVAIGQDIVAPTAEAGTGGELSCTITQMSLNATGSSSGNNFTYQWTSTNGNIVNGETSLNPAVNAPGFYEILVTNTTNGCTATDQVQITEDDDLPVVNAGTAQPITCLVSEVTLNGSGSASGPNFTYQWSTNLGNIVSGGTTTNPVVNAPGTYVLTVTNTATNCTNLGSVVVQAQTAPPAAEAGPSDELTCTETSLALNGAGSATGNNFTYEWTTVDGMILNGANTLTPMIGNAGTYQLLVTNSVTGCTNTDQVTITQSLDAPQAVAAAPVGLTCEILSVTLDGAGTSTGNNFTYQWTTQDGNIVSGVNSLAPSVNQPGTYQLLVTNTTNGCTQTAQAIVSQNIQPPTAEAGTSDQLTCTVQTVTLDGAGSSSGLGFSYQWSTINGNIVSGATSLSPTVNQTGTYTLLVTNTSNGCTSSDQVVVGQDDSLPQAVIAQPGKLTCDVNEITLNASASQGTDFQYGWTTTGGSIISGATTLTPEINAPGVYILTVTNLANGCTKVAQITVSQDIAAPVADAGAAFVMDCFDDVNYLDGSGSNGNGNLSYQWSTSNGSLVSGVNSAKPGVNEPGTYLLTVTNLGNGCTDTDQVTITRDGPSVEAETQQPLCYGDRGLINLSGTVGGQQPYLYSINGGNSFGTQAIFNNLQSGSYDIVVQDARGCEFKTATIIDAPDQFNIDVEPQVLLTLGDSYQINTLVNFPLDDIAQVTWFPSNTLSCADCLNPVATPTTTTLYKVTVVTKNGCEDTAPILFRVDKRGGVYVPNAFSPNGDGTNDVFMIYSDSKSVSKIKSFLVFNRWGETVFEYYNFSPNNPAYGWDGFHRGQPVDPAVFVWFATVEFIDGRIELIEGDVTLMN